MLMVVVCFLEFYFCLYLTIYIIIYYTLNMDQLEKVVIRAINGNLGLPESDTSYDSRVL